MANIDDKLTYLSETKNIFKNSLNSLGAEIASSTTFRNYLNWLDSFYDDASDKTDLSVNGIVGRTSQDTAILPSEYTQVDYIESSDAQYIDTGVNADSNLRVVLDMRYSVSPADKHVGAINRTSNSYIRYHFDVNGGKWRGYYGSGTVSYKFGTPDLNRHIFDFDAPNKVYKVDDISSPTFSYTSFDTGLNYWLFGRNSNDSSLIKYASAKLYAGKMYYNNELVRDFIPCYRRSDNEVGLYDLVNDVFYTNQGTGAFTYDSVASIPNPDYPQPINNLTGNVAYKVNGKNILQISDTYNNRGITSTYDKNTGYITSKGTTTSSWPRINDIQVNMPAGTTVTLSSDLSSYTVYIRFYRDDSNYEQVSTTADNTRTRTLEYDINRLLIILNTPADTEINETYYLQLEKGSEVTSFEPCVSQTFNIPLGDIELCKIDTYEDKIYSSEGRFYLEKNVNKLVLNGSSNALTYYGTYGVDNAPLYYIDIGTFIQPPDYNTTIIYSEHYKQWLTTLSGAQRMVNNGIRGATASHRIYIRDDRYTSSEDMNGWLSNNNDNINYVLQNPTTTEITQENYPSLYNALKQIQDYLTAYKINKEFVLGYSNPEIEY